MYTGSPIHTPSTLLALLEPARAAIELGALVSSSPVLNSSIKSRGDGHATLVLPGFLTSDISTLALRRNLHNWGYRARRWKMGVNLGPHMLDDLDERLLDRLEKLYKHTGKKVSIIGWSLGGLYARELAKQCPDYTRQVITLGSPVGGDIKSIKIWRLYELLTGLSIESDEVKELMQRVVEPVKDVPVTSIYSRTDGLVAPENAQVPELPLKQNIQVLASHIGIGMNPLVHYIIADRLAQHEDNWRPFHYDGWRRYAYS